MTKRTHAAVHPQHDAHCNVFDKQLQDHWEDFPPDINEMTPQVTTSPVEEDAYVIAKSDSIEHLYWCGGQIEQWSVLAHASHYTRDELTDNKEPVDGFWMTLERAQELEE